MKDIMYLGYIYSKKQRVKMLLYILICLMAFPLPIFTPYITGDFLDNVFIGGSHKALYQYCFVLGGIFFLKVLLDFTRNILYVHLQMTMAFQFNRDVIKVVQKINSLEIEKMNTSYICQQINSDTNEIIIFILTFMLNCIVNILTLFIPIGFMMSINLQISFYILLFLLLYVLNFYINKKKLYGKNKEYKEAQSTYFAYLYEQFRYINFIKIHSAYLVFSKRLSKAFKDLKEALLKYQIFTQLLVSSNILIRLITQLGLFLLCGNAIIDGTLTIGQFTIFFSYFTLIVSSASYFVNLGKLLQEVKVSYTRIKKILEISVSKNGNYQPTYVEEINIKNLVFSYGEKAILHKINFVFKKGKIYSIVGANGSGKSTLINIITGIYDGDFMSSVFLNGVEMRNVDLQYYRKKLLAVVEQETVLIEDTFLTNILLDDEGITDFKYIDGLTKAFKLDTILDNSCENEYDFMINESSNNLSGGEKQKIAIIRALVKGASIMLFDEPTSALDSESKRVFYEILQTIKKEKIIVIITHDEYLESIADKTYYLS